MKEFGGSKCMSVPTAPERGFEERDSDSDNDDNVLSPTTEKDYENAIEHINHLSGMLSLVEKDKNDIINLASSEIDKLKDEIKKQLETNNKLLQIIDENHTRENIETELKMKEEKLKEEEKKEELRLAKEKEKKLIPRVAKLGNQPREVCPRPNAVKNRKN
jgi:hypothetical protein